MNKKVLLLLAIIAAGAFLRFYRLESRTIFDADQEEAAFRALEVLRGEPVLLGPKMSIGSYSIGPIFIYLWAFFSFLVSGNPAAGSYLSLILGLITILLFFFSAKVFYGEKTAFAAAFLSAVSFNFITWDQNPWAPSLFYLAQSLLLLGAYLSSKNPKGLNLVALGFVLGFSAHLGILLSIFAVTFFWLIYPPKLKKVSEIFLPALIVFLGILPNLVYDLANGFVNTKRLIDVFSQSQSGLGPGLGRITSVVSYSGAGHIIPFLDKKVSLLLFAFILGIGIIGVLKDKKFRKVLVLLIFSILIPCLLFLFYRGSFSEYYLMMTIPPFFLLFAYLVFKIIAKSKLAAALLLTIIFLTNIKGWLELRKPMNLAAKRQAVRFIMEGGGSEGYGVSLTTAPGWHFGYRYIFSYYGASPDIPPLKNQKKIFTIVVPPGYEGVEAKKEFDGVGVLWEGVD